MFFKKLGKTKKSKDKLGKIKTHKVRHVFQKTRKN